jgi:hypothetical protein
MARTAKCLCCQFSVIVTCDPTVVNVCHCRDCQRRSGVPWTSTAYFPKEYVRLEDPIESTPAQATQGLGSIIISVRAAVSLFVGPAR